MKPDPRSSRIAIFGGSFDPPHLDHAGILSFLVHNRPHDIDAIWVLVADRHAHGKDLAPLTHRLAMVDVMIDSVRKGAPTDNCIPILALADPAMYMADSLTRLRDQVPDAGFYLVVGGDIIRDKDKWERWDEVTRQAEIIQMARENGAPGGFDFKGRGFSSTSIRTLLRDFHAYLGGADVPHFIRSPHPGLDPDVARYIRINKLYRDPEAPKPSVAQGGYHRRTIQKGVYGTLSKVQEELDELVDAHEQGIRLMELAELADLVGAIQGYVEREHPGTSMTDLLDMAAATKRAFESGRRG